MDQPEIAKIAQRYAALADEFLLRDFHLSPDAYRDRETWDIIAEEVMRRGLHTSTDVTAVEDAHATAPAAFEALFCDRCRTATAPVSSPARRLTVLTFLAKVIVVGDYLLGRSDQCATCGSYVSRLWFVLGIPLIPLDRYRLIDLANDQLVTRKIVAA